jgi:hypothetical protein
MEDSHSIGDCGGVGVVWLNFTRALKQSHICLVDREDELVWALDPFGIYTPKMGYTQLNIELHLRVPEWWWKGLWKLCCPLKSKIFMWSLIAKKVPTWEVMRKRQVVGPGWCILCKQEEESQVHLFISCPFSKAVWKEVEKMQGKTYIWQGQLVEEAWKLWISSPSNKNFVLSHS